MHFNCTCDVKLENPIYSLNSMMKLFLFPNLIITKRKTCLIIKFLLTDFFIQVLKSIKSHFKMFNLREQEWN